MINFDFDKFCYGCGICVDVCPVNAITMQPNMEGFPMPVVDEKKCIQCGKCDRSCMYLNRIEKQKKIEKKYYAVYGLKERKWLEKSSSGGVFPALAKTIIDRGGFVCGCVWNDDMEAEHIVTDNWDDVVRMFHSKYTQSKTEGCYRKVQEILKQGKLVLFSGTPCQISGVLSFTNHHESLYTCDVICKGVPSPGIWRRYKAYIEKTRGSKIRSIVLRSKHKYGWTGPVTRYEFENGSTREDLFFQLNHFIVGFLDGLYMRNSCYRCQFKDENHDADIVLGDFWGIGRKTFQKSRNQGVSAVIIQTEKGQGLFDDVKELFSCVEVTRQEMAERNPSMTASTPYNDKRDQFFEQLDKLPIEENIAQYTNYYSWKNKVIRFMDKTGLFKIFKWVQTALYR